MSAITDAVVALREAETKATVLHEACIKAHGEMREATNQHEFLVQATWVADRARADAQHRVESLIRSEAYAVVAEQPEREA